ncbi:flippase [Halorubrum sp. 48-1-W]|uniref:oligosaccharide flippase family protein n=1 Tax=Halorubrum sp. 48-1-W TaxID=2249761 RepID=UPI000DCCCED2|nr:polysaccharide biosynthesis C-terminal domain-containing protein [Halorubrum sp. 48-1-W]RAW44729.1 flippase [Halorubrum sp. 48-1-W]
MSRNLFRAFFSIFGTKVGVLAIGMLTTPLIVRILGSEGYGNYAVLISIFGVLTVFTNAGIFNGIRKYIAEDRDIDHWNKIVFSFYFRISILATGLLALILVTFSQTSLIVELLSAEFQTYFAILAAYLFVSQFYSMGRGVLMGFGLEHYSEPLQMVNKVIYAVIALSLLYYEFGVNGLLIGHVTAAVIVGALAFWFVREKLSFRQLIRPVPNTVSRRQLLTFNVYSILLAFLTISLYHVDILLLRPISGSSVTGFYKASLTVAEFLWLVPMAIQYTLVQSTSEMWSKNQDQLITTIASSATRLNLSLVVIMGIGLAALADVFVPLYFGAEFTPAVGPLLLLLPGVLGFSLSRPIFAIGQGKGQLRSLVLTTGGAAVLNLFLNLLLIPRYGMYGAAVATSIGYGSMFFLHAWTARRIGFDPVGDLRVARIAVAGVAAAPVVFGLASMLPAIPALIVVPPVGFVVYVVVSIRAGVVDTAEIEQIQNRAPDATDRLFSWLYRLHG